MSLRVATMADCVYAVHTANYEPPEVVALYSNKAAARAHVNDRPGMGYEVSPLTVESTYTLGELASSCCKCGHSLERLSNQWVCSERCWCTMAGCCPRRSS